MARIACSLPAEVVSAFQDHQDGSLVLHLIVSGEDLVLQDSITPVRVLEGAEVVACHPPRQTQTQPSAGEEGAFAAIEAACAGAEFPSLFLVSAGGGRDAWRLVSYADDSTHSARGKMVLANARESVPQTLGTSHFLQCECCTVITSRHPTTTVPPCTLCSPALR